MLHTYIGRLVAPRSSSPVARQVQSTSNRQGSARGPARGPSQDRLSTGFSRYQLPAQVPALTTFVALLCTRQFLADINYHYHSRRYFQKYHFH